MLNIGSILKSARVEQGMTLEDLSSKCGYSKALISRIENNTVSPSITSLSKITNTLGLQLYEVFASVAANGPTILRSEEREKLSGSNGEHEVEFLTNTPFTKKLQPVLISLKGGAKPWEGSDLDAGEKFLHVLKGTAEIVVGGRKHVLKAGDSIYLKSAIPYKYRSIGKGKTVSLAVTHSPY